MPAYACSKGRVHCGWMPADGSQEPSRRQRMLPAKWVLVFELISKSPVHGGPYKVDLLDVTTVCSDD